jgi:hypothetical protein
MVQVKTGEFKGFIGSLFCDNELISIFDEITQIWYTVPVSVGYEVL